MKHDEVTRLRFRRAHIGIRATTELEDALSALIDRMERAEHRRVTTTEAITRAVTYMERLTRTKEETRK